jgi:hypothetical protein
MSIVVPLQTLSRSDPPAFHPITLRAPSPHMFAPHARSPAGRYRGPSGRLLALIGLLHVFSGFLPRTSRIVASALRLPVVVQSAFALASSVQDFLEADLSEARLTNADLTGAILKEANLLSADLSGTYLNTATGTAIFEAVTGTAPIWV